MERGKITLDEAAAVLKVSPSTVRRLIAERSLPAHQLCKGAPWVIKAPDLEHPEVRNAARRVRRPSSGDLRQKSLNYDGHGEVGSMNRTRVAQAAARSRRWQSSERRQARVPAWDLSTAGPRSRSRERSRANGKRASLRDISMRRSSLRAISRSYSSITRRAAI
uniref:helix-turn-helix domain-containing protein n=1 Tax=Bradyrhizobium australiense TaxID=2721161 RepID=UPI0035E38150